jgi:hypothetical protein
LPDLKGNSPERLRYIYLGARTRFQFLFLVGTFVFD